MELTRLSKFVETVPWTFAKSYAKYPHWWLHLNKLSTQTDRQDFFELVKNIFENGVDEDMWFGRTKKTYRYLYLGKYKYWVMDPSIEETDLINRAEVK